MLLKNQRAFSGPASITDNMDATVTKTTILEIAVPAGIVGTLHPRSGNHAGTLVLPTGHGITEGNSIVVFWEAGYTQAAFAAGAVTATTVAISGAPGDNLPADNSPIIVAKKVSVEWPVRFIPTMADVAAIQFDPAQSTDLPFVGRMHVVVHGGNSESGALAINFDLANDQLVILSEEFAGAGEWTTLFADFISFGVLADSFDLYNGTKFGSTFKLISAAE